MSKRIINDDVKVKKGSRTAIKIGKKELAERLWDYTECAEEGELFTGSIYEDDYVSLLNDSEEHFESDLEYANYVENYMTAAYYGDDRMSGTPLLGFCTLENGLTFYGVMGGADWAYPMFSIFYYDGENARAYTPVHGNFVNVDCMCALGLEGEYNVFDENELAQKYKELGIYEEADMSGVSEIGKLLFHDSLAGWDEMYLKKYGLDEPVLDWDAIKKEIMDVIIVK